jgi:hypothetical protein
MKNIFEKIALKQQLAELTEAEQESLVAELQLVHHQERKKMDDPQTRKLIERILHKGN